MTSTQIDAAVKALEYGLNRTRKGIRLVSAGLGLVLVAGGLLAWYGFETRSQTNQTQVIVSRSPCANLTARDCAIKLERARRQPPPRAERKSRRQAGRERPASDRPKAPKPNRPNRPAGPGKAPDRDPGSPGSPGAGASQASSPPAPPSQTSTPSPPPITSVLNAASDLVSDVVTSLPPVCLDRVIALGDC